MPGSAAAPDDFPPWFADEPYASACSIAAPIFSSALAISAFEACFMSAAHGDAEIASALEKMGAAMEQALA